MIPGPREALIRRGFLRELARLDLARRVGLPWGPYEPPGAGRDERVDLLRGFCVLAMVVDHIGGPSVLYWVTGGNRFYTSAAEAFILISGLVMGLVYRRLIERDGLGPSLRRAIERSATLYLLTITLSLIFIPASEILNLHWAQGIDFSDPVGFVASVLLLHRTYYLVDIPLLYTILIILSPLALALMSQGRGGIILGASWLLWGAYQVFPDLAEAPWPIAGNHLFYLSAWQVFFFTGLFLGWQHGTLTERLAHFPRRRALLAATVGFAALVVLYKLSGQLARFWPTDPGRVDQVQLWLLEAVFAKGDVRPGRIVASVVVFGFFYLLVTEAWRPLSRGLGWLLIPLGQGALYAYSAHVIIAIPVGLALDRVIISDRYARPTAAAIQVAVLLLIWLLLRWRVLDVNPSRGRVRYLWPAGATAACLALLSLAPLPTAGVVAAAQAAAAPDPHAARVARAFGTPVPGRPLRGEGPPVALPAPRAQPAPGAPTPVSEYVGPIKGELRNIQFFSPALDRDMPYFVYLPPGYNTDGRRYPVLYMLHGNSGSYEEWVAYGLIDHADRMIVGKEILPMIVVLPQGDFSYWVNLVPDGPRYGDYLAEDLVRHISATYRVLPGPERRAIGGLSNGAHAALMHAFRSPDIFRVVGAHSASLPYEGEREFLGTGEDFASRSPTRLAETAERLHELTIWIDVGDEDMWLERNMALHRTLEGRDIDHIWDLSPGGDHWGGYWSARIPDYLRFYDAAFQRERRL